MSTVRLSSRALSKLATLIAVALLAIQQVSCRDEEEAPGCPSRPGRIFCQKCGDICEYCPSGSSCTPCGTPTCGRSSGLVDAGCAGGGAGCVADADCCSGVCTDGACADFRGDGLDDVREGASK